MSVPSTPPSPAREAPPSADGRSPDWLAGTLLGVGVVLLFLVGRVLLAPLGIAGAGLAQWLFLALPLLLALRAGGYALVPSLGLRPISRRTLLGAGLLMLGGLSLNWLVAWIQSRWIEVPTGVAEAMSAQLRADGLLEMLGLLVVAALTPALCEEAVFRGVLLRAWRRWPALPAITLNALFFGTLHWMPGTGFRILPAATSGALIAWAVWETRSLWTGVWMHLLNNGFLLIAASAAASMEVEGAEEAAALGATSAPPLQVLIPMLAIAALGVHLLRTDTPPSPPSPRAR